MRTTAAQRAGVETLTAGPDLLAGAAEINAYTRRALVPLTALVTDHSAMIETLASGRVSETPDAVLFLRVRDDVVGRYEIADGHHRVARALSGGATHLWADIDLIADEEPYEGPFFDFAAALGG